jgi:hypothetical protein
LVVGSACEKSQQYRETASSDAPQRGKTPGTLDAPAAPHEERTAMNKRIRKKHAKQQAEEAETTQSASSALQQAVEELKDSATHLIEIAWSELQRGAVAWVELLRNRATDLLSSIKPSSAATPKTNSAEHAHGQSNAA